MTFEELLLERYGVYEKLSATFVSPGLNVVYGPNEAGKSTCLAAISDFLFGVPNNSSRGRIYGYDGMRIGAILRLADGTRLELRRRKGRGKTLLDHGGRPVEDSVLGKVLGSVTRERFDTMFGLDHRSLREGGETLLSAAGDIGRLILEAGGGLRGLVKNLENLKEQAESLFAPRRSEGRRFYLFLDAFEQAEGEVKHGTLTFEAYQQAIERLNESQRKHNTLRERRANLEVRQSALERAHRVLPLLRQLDHIGREIERYVDVAHLRPEFTTEVKNTFEKSEQANIDFDESAKRRKNLEDQIKDLMIDRALLVAEAEIATIHEKSFLVAKERQDRRSREKELEEQNARLMRLREYFNLGPDVDLKKCLPSADVRQHVQQLASEGKSLKERKEALEKQVADIGSESESIGRKQEKLAALGFSRPLDVDVANAKALPRLLREIEDRNREAESIGREIKKDLAKWTFGDIETLRHFQCPDLESIEGEIGRRQKIADEIKSNEDDLREAHKKLSVAQKAMERLQASGQVPTDAAIDQARSVRKSAWQPIRSAYLSNDSNAFSSIPRPDRESNANKLEDQIEQADRLSDRKSAEAKRLTDLAAAEKQWDEASVEIEAGMKVSEELENEVAEQVRQFVEAWPEATQKESDLTRLKLLVRHRDVNLERADRVASLRGEARVRQGEADLILAQLTLAESDLGLRPTPDTELETRLRNVERSFKEHKQGYDEWSRNAAALGAMEKQLGKARHELGDLETKHVQWQNQWCQAMGQIGLSIDTTTAFVERVITEWSEAAPALALIDSTHNRLKQFDQDERALASLINELSLRLTVKLPDDPVAAARMLSDRLRTVKELDTQGRTLAKQLRDAVKDSDEKLRRRDELNGRVQILCAEAIAADEVSLLQIAGRVESLVKERHAWDQVVSQISAAGDGKPLEKLRAECEGVDPDAVKAEIEGIKSDKEHLDGEIQQAYAEMHSCKAELENFASAAGINGAESRRQSAAAEMRALIERYLEVELARELLSQAINRLREEQQDPLIARAGQLFRLATGKTFAGIATDIDDHGNPVVVGKRDTAKHVHVDLMSDGTRDQLFLAFRIASIEQYCKQAEPLPFIADDLLVHFDDDRSKAAMAMLAELGLKTQVLLFTHHRSVRDMAQSLAAQGNVSIYDLAA